ncbi:hypothetical protein AURDEDRAFT_116475 [Auricularia subglabra TFB-10046 SS5]|nr:hypothetical protein AURDEDRAFT_116475 [Auricularia subglabra TFB-10046 SS5]
MEALAVPEPSSGATLAERRLLWWKRILVNSVFVVAWYILLRLILLSGTLDAGVRKRRVTKMRGRRCVQNAVADPAVSRDTLYPSAPTLAASPSAVVRPRRSLLAAALSARSADAGPDGR